MTWFPIGHNKAPDEKSGVERHALFLYLEINSLLSNSHVEPRKK